MSYSLPGLSFRLFGFPVTIQLDFFLIVLLLGFDRRPGVYLIEWLVVVALAILVHELGHAFAVRAHNIHPEIRLWGLGGLTIWGFALPPRKALVVSAAGPLVGIPIGLFAMVLLPWLPANAFLLTLVGDVRDVSLLWGIVNLLPIAGLDGGAIVEQLFALGMGARGRTPGLVTVAVGSIVVAIGAALIGQIYLALIIFLFGLMNPGPYLELRRAFDGLGGRGRRGPTPSSGSWPSRTPGFTLPGRAGGSSPSLASVRTAAPVEERRTSRRVTPAVVVAAQVRRPFGELYAETLGAPELDLDDFEDRPEPLLADVTRMLARGDDAGVAARLAADPDPLAVLGIVARVIDEKRLRGVLAAARGLDPGLRGEGLLRLQATLHALGRFDDSITAGDAVGEAGGAPSAVLEARSAARIGDKRRARAALERSIELGPIELSDAALGDIVRVGPDPRIAELLAQLRKGVAS